MKEAEITRFLATLNFVSYRHKFIGFGIQRTLGQYIKYPSAADHFDAKPHVSFWGHDYNLTLPFITFTLEVRP